VSLTFVGGVIVVARGAIKLIKWSLKDSLTTLVSRAKNKLE
jgi:hypothetical protein